MKKMPLGKAFLILSIFIFFQSHAFEGERGEVPSRFYPDFKILSASNNSIVLEFTPIDVTIDTLTINSGRYMEVNFFGGRPHDQIIPELPDLRFRDVTITLPTNQNPTFEILRADYERVRGVRIPPMGDLVMDSDSVISRTLTGIRMNVDEEVPIVDIQDIGNVRGAILGTLRFSPVHLERDGRSVRIYSRIVVRVNFPTGSFGAIDRESYSVLRNVVLNIDQLYLHESNGWIQTGVQGGMQPVSSVLASGPWYSFTIGEEGIYRITRNMLAEVGIPVDNIDPRTLRIFGNGGKMLPEDITDDRPEDLIELAIYVQGEQNGSFDPGDQIVFFGRSVHSWDYDYGEQEFVHRYNYYTDNNRYFLTYGGPTGKRMEMLGSLQDTSPFQPSYFLSRILHREPQINLLDSGKDWMGHHFGQHFNELVFSNNLHGFTPAEPIQYRLQVAARAPTVTHFYLYDQTIFLGDIAIPATSMGSLVGHYARRGPLSTFYRSGSLPNNISNLRFVYDGGHSADGYLEWFEIHYPRKFEALNDYLQFNAPDQSGVHRYVISGYSGGQIRAFDISDHSSVKRITGGTSEGGTLTYQVQIESGELREYAVVGQTGYLSPSELSPVQNSDLRGITGGARFIIISPDEFLNEAEALKNHRETYAHNQVSTIVVRAESVYNEFSGGLLDPTAIRDFLHHAYTYWSTTPYYVLLLGSGSFDYKRILNQRINYIPMYQSDESLHQTNTYASDNFFVNFNPDSRRPSMAIGRLNTISLHDTQVQVNKILYYETSSDFGAWRNMITFVADDGDPTGSYPKQIHTSQSEQLANIHTPPSFEKLKIYMIMYPVEHTAFGRRKPAVNEAIIESFNRGTLIMNWTGHGNPNVWAHERVFVSESTVPQLNNRDQLTFLTAATCDFGRIDNPRQQGGAERLMSRQEGGAIGVFSPTRVTFSAPNAVFNNEFYSNLLTKQEDGLIMRIGDAAFATKQVNHTINSIKFMMMGDPTLRLHAPSHKAQIAKINDRRIVKGVPINIKALQKVTLEGSTFTPGGDEMEDYYGRMFTVVYDSQREVIIDEWDGFTFTLPGHVIFRGENSITGGEYNSAFVVPKDISHEGKNGRIALYFWEGGIDGSGFNANVVFGGIDTTAAVDTVGPDIWIYLEDRNFRSGDLVGESPMLIVDLFDDHGINISGAGVGHNIEAVINDVTSIDLTEFYLGNIDTYQEGTIEYQLENLPEGPHHISVKAWDVYNNSNIEESFFTVALSEKLSIKNVYNYPNPFGRETTFTFQHNQSIPLDVEVKIYTVAGRLIAELKKYHVTDRFVRIPWSGRDNDGDLLANGVYLYKVVARTVDGTFTSEALGKMAVIR